MENVEVKRCFLCQCEVSGECLCPHCENAYFCSQDHFRVHRGTIKSGKGRKDVCWPFRIECRPIVGNVMVASRDISATETILEEPVAIWGPNCKSKPLCLECLKPLYTVAPKDDVESKSSAENNEDGAKKIAENGENLDKDPQIDGEKKTTSGPKYFCSKCGFPVCDEKCEKGPNHQSECPVLSGWKDKSDLDFTSDNFILELMAVLPLRLLNLSETNPDLSKRVNLLMDHVADMGKDEKKVWEDYVVGTVRGKCGIQKYSPEELLRAIGMICTNAVSQGILLGQGIYPTFSFISHNCFNNSRFQVYQDRRLVLRAQLNIAKGDEVTILYLPPMLGNVRRRIKIKRSWHFECTCIRCSDKTEFGSMLDAIVCQKCKNAEGEVGYLLPENSLEENGIWRCDKCPNNVGGFTVAALMKGLEEEMETLKEQDPEKIEALVKTWSDILHPTHFIMLTLKKRLMDLYRLHPLPQDNPELLRRWLERQVQLGQEQLDIVDKLQPGYSLRRGRILRLLHGPTLHKAKLDLSEGLISPPQFVAITRLAIQRMKEAIKCLEDFDLSAVDMKSGSHSGEPVFIEEGALAAA